MSDNLDPRPEDLKQRVWESIQRDIGKFSAGRSPVVARTAGIPMANGAMSHG